MQLRTIRLAAASGGAALLVSATFVFATGGQGVVDISTRGDGIVTGSTNVNIPGQIKLQAKNGMRVFDQELTVEPGGYIGWHSHPGPVLVTVKAGTFRYQELDCTFQEFTSGQTFVDEGGGHVHNGRNPGTTDVELSITYLLPTGAGTRIDVPLDQLPDFTVANCL